MEGASLNSFSLGAQVGGFTSNEATAQEQELRNLINDWKGDYSRDIKEFAFVLRIDGSIHTYTEMWNIVGAQKAKRKRDWVVVEIGIPERWWREAQFGSYKKRLAIEVEKELVSMIDLLRRNRRHINAEALLDDWAKVKSKYFIMNTPPEELVDGWLYAKSKSLSPKGTIQ
jgi:hypothetical protein